MFIVSEAGARSPTAHCRCGDQYTTSSLLSVVVHARSLANRRIRASVNSYPFDSSRRSRIDARVVPFDKATAVPAAGLFNQTGKHPPSQIGVFIRRFDVRCWTLPPRGGTPRPSPPATSPPAPTFGLQPLSIAPAVSGEKWQKVGPVSGWTDPFPTRFWRARGDAPYLAPWDIFYLKNPGFYVSFPP